MGVVDRVRAVAAQARQQAVADELIGVGEVVGGAGPGGDHPGGVGFDAVVDQEVGDAGAADAEGRGVGALADALELPDVCVGPWGLGLGLGGIGVRAWSSGPARSIRMWESGYPFPP